MKYEKIIYLKLRFVLAFIFLWAFFDKVFGLGFATPSERAWINGGSPTTGFLSHTEGIFSSFFQSLAGQVWVDWMFMAGLLFVGLSLLLNKYVFWGAVAGIIMLILMWLALILPENNPIVDDHIVYALVLALLAIKSKQGVLSLK